nr:type II toxin-antitoxin system Phd/YefM family antitoxin [Salmonella enterica]
MKTVTDAEFLANMGEMLDYLRSGGSVVITAQGQKNIVLTASDLEPEQMAAISELKKVREQIKKINQLPLMQTRHELEKRYPALFYREKRALSFEEAMKRTREKHAEVIKKLEDN